MKTFRKKIIAQWRDFKAVFLEFKWTMLFFLALNFISALILWGWYDKEELSFSEAFYVSLRMIFFDIDLDYPDSFPLQLLFIFVPLIGVIIVVEGLLRFVNTLFAKASHMELWQEIKANTYSDHVIVCGSTHLGHRVTRLLTELGEEVVIITKDPESAFIDELQEEGIPVFVEDCIQGRGLQKANISKAKSIIVVEKDDLTNIGIVLEAKELNPDVQIVLGLFNEKLAERLTKEIHIYRVFSPSFLAAPAVARTAATAFKCVSIMDSIYFGGITAFIASFTLNKDSKLIGKKLEDLEEMGLNVIVFQRGNKGKMNFHPLLDQEMIEEDFIIGIAQMPVLKKIEYLNCPSQTIIKNND